MDKKEGDCELISEVRARASLLQNSDQGEINNEPILWLYVPESFFAQAFIAELSEDPAILESEIYQIAQVASKRKIEIVSKRDGEEPTKYKFIKKEARNLEPLESVNYLGSFQTLLEGLGFTLIPA